MKKIQRSGQAHFLSASSPDSSPPDRLALLLARVLPNVSLLAGYLMTKMPNKSSNKFEIINNTFSID